MDASLLGQLPDAVREKVTRVFAEQKLVQEELRQKMLALRELLRL